MFILLNNTFVSINNKKNNFTSILSELNKPESLIDFVPDRYGHDQRYAIDPEKANKELGWDPITTFEVGIKKTIEWYLSEKGSTWLDECMKQNQEWLEKNYKNRI